MPRASGPRAQPDGLHHQQSEGEERGKRGACTDPKGYDAGKKISGIKRHIVVDTQGPMIHAVVRTADIQRVTTSVGISRGILPSPGNPIDADRLPWRMPKAPALLMFTGLIGLGRMILDRHDGLHRRRRRWRRLCLRQGSSARIAKARSGSRRKRV